MTAEQYFGDWSRVVDIKEAEKALLALRGQSICPLPKDIFKAFHLCSLNNLKVLILGQDPYPTTNHLSLPTATGIAFANSPDTPKHLFSPSLEVLRDSVIDFTVPHGTINFDPSLETWEEQGVLMLNSALTCMVGKPGSHSLLWRPFISSLITNLSLHLTGIVYVLMGSAAQSFESCINQHSNHIIRIRHPAWYARTNTRMPDIWKDINQILMGMYGEKVEWYKESQ